MIQIRPEESQDATAVRRVNEQAFGRSEEANIVERLRENCGDVLSLVATVDDEIVGHILFSPVTIEGNRTTTQAMGLAPMAVLPAYQRQGVGSKLIAAAIELLDAAHCPAVIVLGLPEYYPRFGFEPAARYGVRCEWEVPEEVFMIRVLNRSVADRLQGTARYRPEFAMSM